MAKKLAMTGPLIVVLSLLAAVGPLAIDLYLPALPTLQVDLGATEPSTQLTLSVFVVGMGLGQLLWGPLSDRLGRRRPLLIGAVVLVLASVLCAVAPNIWVFIGARLLQGLAGAAGMVIGRAVASDLADGAQLARLFSIMGIIMGVAPVLAPVAGGVLAEQIGWRGIMWVLTGLTVVMLLSIVIRIPESLPAQRRSSGQRTHGSNVRRVLGDRRFMALVFVQAFSFAVMFAFITASSFILQTGYGLSETTYAIVFAINAFAIMVGGILNGALVKRVAVTTLLNVAVGILIVGVVGVAVVAFAFDRPPLVLLQVSIAIPTFSLGAIMANTSALGLARHTGATAGLAAAIMGSIQAAMGGLVSPLVSVGGVSVRSMATVMLGCGLVALVSFFVARMGQKPPEVAVVEEEHVRM